MQSQVFCTPGTTQVRSRECLSHIQEHSDREASRPASTTPGLVAAHTKRHSFSRHQRGGRTITTTFKEEGLPPPHHHQGRRTTTTTPPSRKKKQQGTTLFVVKAEDYLLSRSTFATTTIITTIEGCSRGEPSFWAVCERLAPPLAFSDRARDTILHPVSAFIYTTR